MYVYGHSESLKKKAFFFPPPSLVFQMTLLTCIDKFMFCSFLVECVCVCGVEWRCLLISFVFCHWMVHGGGGVSCKHPLSCSPLRPSVSGRSVVV